MMKKVLSVLFIALLAVASGQAIDDDVIDTDAIPDWDPVTTGEADPADLDLDFFDDGCVVDVTNQTMLEVAGVDETIDWDDWKVTSRYQQELQTNPSSKMLGDVGFTISVEDITRAIQGGGNNPVERLIIAKVVEVFNRAGVSVRGGSLVYSMTNGPNIALASGCNTEAHLEGGWGAQATLKPATALSVRMSFSDMTLVINTKLHADTAFGMSGSIRARIGKKVLGKCVRIARKTSGVKVGAQMVLDIETQLSIKPTLTSKDGQLYIGLQPQIWVGGNLLVFEPTASSSFTIFGIHIRSIERKIKEAITAEMRRQVTPGKIQQELAKLQESLQVELNRIFAGIVFPLPRLQGDLLNKVQGAVNNIKAKQF